MTVTTGSLSLPEAIALHWPTFYTPINCLTPKPNAHLTGKFTTRLTLFLFRSFNKAKTRIFPGADIGIHLEIVMTTFK